MTDEFASTLPAATVSCNVSAAARIAIAYAHVDRRVRARASINSGRSCARLLLRILINSDEVSLPRQFCSDKTFICSEIVR